MITKKRKVFLIFCLAFLHLGLSLYWSRNILFNYGKIIPTWEIFYKGFWKNLYSDYVPPGFYILSGLVHSLTHRSIPFCQKLIDLLSGELIVVLLSFKTIKNKKWWLTPLIGFSSLGFISPLISQGGEGIVSLLIILGLYFWQEKKYVKGCLLFAGSLWFKFLFYFIFPGLIIFIFLHRKEYLKNFQSKRKELILGFLFFCLGFIIYHFLDNFQDLSFQVGRFFNNNATFASFSIVKKFFSTLILYSLALIIGFPFLLTRLIKSEKDIKDLKQNIFFFSGLSLLFSLSLIGFVYYYSFSLFALFFVAIFSQAKLTFIKTKETLVVLLLSLIFFTQAPFLTFAGFRAISKQDYQKTLSLIKPDYQGGVVVLPLNFSLEFPYRSFISDALPEDRKSLKQIEWIVAKDNIPSQLLKIPECGVVFKAKVSERINLYKFNCDL